MSALDPEPLLAPAIRRAIARALDPSLEELGVAFGPCTDELASVAIRQFHLSRLLLTNSMVAGTHISYRIHTFLYSQLLADILRLHRLATVRDAYQEILISTNSLAQATDAGKARMFEAAVIDTIVLMLVRLEIKPGERAAAIERLSKELMPLLPYN